MELWLLIHLYFLFTVTERVSGFREDIFEPLCQGWYEPYGGLIDGQVVDTQCISNDSRHAPGQIRTCVYPPTMPAPGPCHPNPCGGNQICLESPEGGEIVCTCPLGSSGESCQLRWRIGMYTNLSALSIYTLPDFSESNKDTVAQPYTGKTYIVYDRVDDVIYISQNEVLYSGKLGESFQKVRNLDGFNEMYMSSGGGLAIDHTSRRLYAGLPGRSSIIGFPLQADGREDVILNVPGILPPRKIGISSKHRLIYWMDTYGIKRGNLDDFRADSIKAVTRDMIFFQPEDRLFVDDVSEILIWTEYRLDTDERTIVKASLDGSSPRKIWEGNSHIELVVHAGWLVRFDTVLYEAWYINVQGSNISSAEASWIKLGDWNPLEKNEFLNTLFVL